MYSSPARVLFVGGSTTRQIFWALAKRTDQEGAEMDTIKMLDLNDKHRDLELGSAGVSTIHFIRDRFLNSSGSGLDHEVRSSD